MICIIIIIIITIIITCMLWGAHALGSFNFLSKWTWAAGREPVV